MKEYHDIRPDDAQHAENSTTGILDLSQLPIETSVANIDDFPIEYPLLRKRGLGGSDASAILGVSPYTSRSDLIAEKCRAYITEEEKAIGDKVAVQKGRDYEPLIMDKYAGIIGQKVFKPTDMYRFKSYPWLAMNFDGVVDKIYLPEGKYQYIPAEIKVITAKGERHYDLAKAWFHEGIGFGEIPQDFSLGNNSIQTRAAQYGIPPYYYTQLQQEMMALNAPFGYLTVLLDRSWQVATYFVWQDRLVQASLIAESHKVWAAILDRREPGFDETLATNIRNAASQSQTTDSATLGTSDTSSKSPHEVAWNTAHEWSGNKA